MIHVTSHNDFLFDLFIWNDDDKYWVCASQIIPFPPWKYRDVVLNQLIAIIVITSSADSLEDVSRQVVASVMK